MGAMAVAPSPSPLPSDLTVAELWQRARDYREMAETTTDKQQREALLRLVWRYKKLAVEKGRKPG